MGDSRKIFIFVDENFNNEIKWKNQEQFLKKIRNSDKKREKTDGIVNPNIKKRVKRDGEKRKWNGIKWLKKEICFCGKRESDIQGVSPFWRNAQKPLLLFVWNSETLFIRTYKKIKVAQLLIAMKGNIG